jgi:hypothetical protein
MQPAARARWELWRLLRTTLNRRDAISTMIVTMTNSSIRLKPCVGLKVLFLELALFPAAGTGSVAPDTSGRPG